MNPGDGLNLFAFIVVGLLAFVGLIAIVHFSYRWISKAWQILCGLNDTLREAVELMKAHRGDLQVLRTIDEAVRAQAQEAQPAPDVIGPERRQAAAAYPTPPWDYYRTEKPEEPDAPDEGIRSVDVTGDEGELIDVEKVELLRAMGMSAPDPEFKPRAVEVNSE